MPKTTKPSSPKRQLSWLRLLILLVVVAVPLSWKYIHRTFVAPKSTVKPWFAAYVDVTLTPVFSFQQMGAEHPLHSVLSFVVAKPNDPCVPSWGAAYSLDQANSALSLDSRLARLRQRGGEAVVSFGGRDNEELAVSCTDEEKLYNAYKQVIERYTIDTIDLDLEGTTVGNQESANRRARVLAKLQADRRKAGQHLSIWLTLPATPQGLAVDGTNMVSTFLKAKVDLSGVNIMTMDYGESLNNLSMLEGSKRAIQQSERQLKILYDRAGISLSSQTLWSKIGATPMIGQNDIPAEVFSLSDATAFNAYAVQQGLGRLSMWSANRDIACGSNYIDLKQVSNSCSSVAQEPEDFSRQLSAHFDGSISDSSAKVTTAETTTKPEDVIDDPKSSPYQIWTATGAYLQGTKVVWRKNVYQAKWWTQGEVPDNPVLQTWETPWELIGPVLPGETPIPLATLPAKTFPEWSGTETYNAGQRVLLNGVPYQAKWWTQGDSPAASAVNPNGSPWAQLTQAQINTILEAK